MKGVSEAVVVVIIAATLITVSLTVFYFSLSGLEHNTLVSEYGYIRTVFTGLANSVPDVLNGASYAARLPKRAVGVGYLYGNSELLVDFYNLSITVYRGGAILLSYSDEPVKLYAKANYPLISVNRLVYGQDNYVVTDTQNIGRIREYYYRGATFLVLDTARVYVSVYEYTYTENNVVRRALSIQAVYVKLSAHLLSSVPTTLSVNRGVDLVNERFIDVTNLKLRFYNNTLNKEVSLEDIKPRNVTYDHVIVTVIVRELVVVLR